MPSVSKSRPLLLFVKGFNYVILSLAFLGNWEAALADKQVWKIFFLILGVVALAIAARLC